MAYPLPEKDFFLILEALRRRPIFAETKFPPFWPGWLDLIEDLATGIEALPGGDQAVNVNFALTVTGCLFALVLKPDRLTADVAQLVEVAKKRAAMTCVICGDPGQVATYERWLRAPLCPVHTAGLGQLHQRAGWRGAKSLDELVASNAAINAAVQTKREQLAAMGVGRMRMWADGPLIGWEPLFQAGAAHRPLGDR